MLEVIELYNNLSTPPKNPGKKSNQSKPPRFHKHSKISPPPLPLTQRLTQLIFGCFALLLIGTLSLTLGAILAVFDGKVAHRVPEWRSHPVETPSPLSSPQLTQTLNILVIGIEGHPPGANPSQTPENQPLETLWLMRFKPDRNQVSVLLIPPQTRVNIPSRGRNPIAQTHAIGGVTLTSQVLSQTLNEIPIDRYIRADVATFRRFIDLLGGIELWVPESLSYRDSTQAIAVDLQPGWHSLKGEETLGFARFENKGGTLSPLHRQQLIWQSIGDRLASPTLSPQLPQIVPLIHEYIDTNLTLGETFGLVHLLQNRSSEALKMVLLPGEFATQRRVSSPDWIVDSIGRDRVLFHYFETELNPGTQGNQAPTSQSSQALKLAVQNASGNPLILGQILTELKAQGYRNVYAVEDWPQIQNDTAIIVQAGDIEAANQLHELLPKARLQASSLGDLNSEITLRIGKDFMGFDPLYWAK